MVDGKATITYHGDRRFTRMIPLQSYGNPSGESKFDGLYHFDFRLKNVRHTNRFDLIVPDRIFYLFRR